MTIHDILSAGLSRRGFLLGAAASGGALLVGFQPLPAAAAGGPLPAPKGVSPFDGHVRIAPDGTVTVIAAHMDMGQGIYHGTATLVAEELGCRFDQVLVEGGAGNVKAYGNLTWGGQVQGTGGSSGLASSFERYRLAGAAAREMLIQAAAKEWALPANELTVAEGEIRHGSGKSAPIGDFAAKAATQPVPQAPALKDPAAWRLIGNEALRRYDGPAKVTGKERFTIDVQLPGMLTAVPIHPPTFGATVKSFDASRAKAVRGVIDVVAHPRGLAVVGEDMWSALKGREAVSVVWDESKAETRSSDALMAEYRRLAKEGTADIAENKGDVEKAFAGAAKVVEAAFSFPYLAHAALEPLNAVARMNADGTLEVWGGHQMPDIYRAIAAKVAGIAPEKVTTHVMKTGGGFGRRAVVDGDVIVEAVAVAKALGFRAPVKMQWTREDDMRGGRYRPMYLHALKAGLDAQGKVVAWQNRIVGQSILKGTPFEGGLVKNGVDLTSVEGSVELPYDMPNRRVELVTTQVGVPVLWWRAVGSTHTAFAVEAFLDELASATGKDAVAFRLEMLKDEPRYAAVLKLAAEKADWDKPAPDGRFRGVALAESFDTIVAQVAEISVVNGRPKVERVTCALDCGIAVNPDVIRQQMEGGIGFGLGAILKSQLTLDKGRVVEGNFDGYDVLRIDEAPVISVHLIASSERPTGVGEPGVPPIGPAVANAFFKATGKRIRALPFSRAENA